MKSTHRTDQARASAHFRLAFGLNWARGRPDGICRPVQQSAGDIMRRTRFSPLYALPLAALVVQGCTVPINVRTTPNGATVFANGQAIGTTPMEIDPEELFPRKFAGYQWERSGTLSFERVGCEPKSLPVDNELLKESVRVKLDCEPGAAAINPLAVPAAAAPAAATPPEETAKRLTELQRMLDEGLISEEEFRTLRQRVLDRF
jgi:hypothetical protein